MNEEFVLLPVFNNDAKTIWCIKKNADLWRFRVQYQAFDKDQNVMDVLICMK